MMRSIMLAVVVAAAAAAPTMAQDATRSGDPASGEKAFAVCKACHQVGPNAKNAVGPELNGGVVLEPHEK